jgi:nitrogen fixation protein NifB
VKRIETMNLKLELDRHPCFNADAKGHCGRVHLPVAPKCNIKCNYCNRKYDCVNESRPGVTSATLSPRQAIEYMKKVLEREPRITVAGIAGPGDPMADPSVTIETLRLLREHHPDLLLCLATNGLGLPDYLDDLGEIGVSHVTVTVNAVDSEIGARIYSWVRDGKVIYRGLKGAELLLERQIESIQGLKERGIIVKVNTIVVPGVNDHHVEAVARRMAELRVDVLNCMPMYPNEDTPFAAIPEPSPEQMVSLRRTGEKYLPQMRHCTRCRADAVGLLDSDRTDDFRSCLTECSRSVPAGKDRPYVAVASMEGVLVNLHLGEAGSFQIWKQTDSGYEMEEERTAPAPGNGLKRWMELAQVLEDCRAVLVAGIGDNPAAVLTESGITPVEMNGFIVDGLHAVYGGGNLRSVKGRRQGCTKGQSCNGGGGGC